MLGNSLSFATHFEVDDDGDEDDPRIHINNVEL
jgi:hypothetical protein